MYEIGDKVRVKKTGYIGKIVGKRELFDNVTYLVEQSNGHSIKAIDTDLEEAK